jgi:hypothetical protein
MPCLFAKRVLSVGLCLLALTGCIAPQQAVQLRFIDAETNQPLRQIEVTQYNASRSSVLPDVPVYGFAGRKAGPPEVTRQVVNEQWRTTLPGNSQVLLAKEGYQPVRIEPRPYGLRIENSGTAPTHDELLLEPTTVIKFTRLPKSETAVTSESDAAE